MEVKEQASLHVGKWHLQQVPTQYALMPEMGDAFGIATVKPQNTASITVKESILPQAWWILCSRMRIRH